MIPGNSKKGYITKAIPDRDRLQRKVDRIAESIKKIPRNYSREQFIGEINRINSQVRGIIQYYQCCTWVNLAMHKYSRRLQLVAKSRLKQYRGKWIPANQTQNLPHIHQQRKQKIPSIKSTAIFMLTLQLWHFVSGRTFSRKTSLKRPTRKKADSYTSSGQRKSE